MEPDPALPADTVEVGAVGGDLPFWRAKEAVRHAELRLGSQAQAAQALEGRATALLGWNVTGLLLLAAAAVNGTHVVPALAAGGWLALAALLCVWAMVSRDFNGVAGYAPEALLNDESPSEYYALTTLAVGYQVTVESNNRAIRRFQRLISGAIVTMVLSPVSGALVLATRGIG